MIDQQTIDRIFDAAQIVEVVSDFVTLRKRGTSYVGLCPFHDDKTPSFYVSPSKNICKCFACGKGGNAVNFIMEHEQISYTEALRYLARKYNIEIKEKELSIEERQKQNERESMLMVNEFARDWFQKQLKENPEGQNVGMAYLRSRGFRDDTIEKFQIGYSPTGRDALAQAAMKEGYKKEYLTSTGLCLEGDDHKMRDRFFSRVIFPIHSISGKVIAFGGRVLASATKGVKVKYLNSPESSIYHKGNELYGIYFAKQAIVKNDCCYLVEGYTDVISMHQAGVENVVASSGTALTDGQIRSIKRFTNNITVLYDGDTAGIKASIRGIDMLLQQGMNIKVCLLPDGEDPDSFARSHSSEEFRGFIDQHQTDFMRFKTHLLLEDVKDDPLKKAALTKDLVQSISVIPDALIRDAYVKECSQLMNVDAALLVREVAKERQQAWEKNQQEKQRQAQRQQNGQNALQENLEVSPVRDGGSQEEEVVVAPPVMEATYLPHAEKSIEKKSNPYHVHEQEILRLIVNFGEQVLFAHEAEDGNQEDVKVIDFICDDLERDGITFGSDLHRKILMEARYLATTPGFSAKKHFIQHEDPEISRYCASLISERYQLSQYHTKNGQTVKQDKDRLIDLVPGALLSLKSAIISSKIKAVSLKMQDPAVKTDKGLLMELVSELNNLTAIQRQMAQKLGFRVIAK